MITFNSNTAYHFLKMTTMEFRGIALILSVTCLLIPQQTNAGLFGRKSRAQCPDQKMVSNCKKCKTVCDYGYQFHKTPGDAFGICFCAQKKEEKTDDDDINSYDQDHYEDIDAHGVYRRSHPRRIVSKRVDQR